MLNSARNSGDHAAVGRRRCRAPGRSNLATVRRVDTAHVRGVDLAYRRAGNGPDIVWGHGLSSSVTGEDLFGLVRWKKILPTHSVLRYDARGHGESDSTDEPASYHWRELARDQLALADALGIGSYVAGGASMGCATALHAAVLAPDRIRALILAIPPTAWETRAAQQFTYRSSADLVETGRLDELIAANLATPAPDPLSQLPQWRDGTEQAIRDADPVRLARIYRGAAVADLPPVEELAAIGVPALILAWTGDPGHPLSTAVRLSEVLPQATLTTATSLEDLLGWTAATVAFLGRVDASRSD